jgi:hypothetical protein
MIARLGQWSPSEYVSNAPRGRGGNYMRPGSLNALVSGDDQLRAFKGVTNLAGKLGGRIIFPADQSYASLGTQAVN